MHFICKLEAIVASLHLQLLETRPYSHRPLVPSKTRGKELREALILATKDDRRLMWEKCYGRHAPGCIIFLPWLPWEGAHCSLRGHIVTKQENVVITPLFLANPTIKFGKMCPLKHFVLNVVPQTFDLNVPPQTL